MLFSPLIYQYAAQQRHANLAFSVSVSFYSLFNYALKGIWSAIFTSCADSLVFSLPCFSHPFQKLLPGFYTNDVIIILLRNRTRMSVLCVIISALSFSFVLGSVKREQKRSGSSLLLHKMAVCARSRVT